jgi:dTDP-4-dehydrorhamnose 3,5-epimerase
MEIRDTRLEGPKLILPRVFGDARGFFGETFRESVLAEHGIRHAWIQDNHSRSDRGVVRGMHFQIGTGAAKLVRCARGEIWDVVVDLRRGSPTYRQWEGFDLTDGDLAVLYVPIGFAHGFVVRSEVADVVYKQTEYYSPDVERGIAYDDPDVAIAWPDVGVPPSVSDRDAAAPRLRDVEDALPF